MPAKCNPSAEPIEYPAGRRKVPPSHPGELMREIVLEHLDLTIADMARRMGVSRRTLEDVLGSRARVTRTIAGRFCRVAGGAPKLFVRMQAARDRWRPISHA